MYNNTGEYYYPLTDNNLQTAIWDLDNGSGTVELCGDLTIDQTIILGEYTTLDLGGNTVTISGNNDGFNLTMGSFLKNGYITTTTYTGNMIYIYGGRGINEGGIEDLTLYNNNYNGTGIMFDCSKSNYHIIFFSVRNVLTYRFEYGINMSCFNDDFASNNYCNANQITDYVDIDSLYEIYLYRNESGDFSTGDITGNTFTNIQLQRRTSPDTVRAIYVSGSSNYFQGTIWDSAGGNRAVELSSASRRTQINMGSLINADISDNGTHNKVISYGFTTMFPYFAQSSPPTINDNCTAYWYDTDGGWLYQVCNTYGTQYYVNMTTSV